MRLKLLETKSSTTLHGVQTDFDYTWSILIDSLYSLVEWLKNLESKGLLDEEDSYMDVRLRYFENQYDILWGDSQYDTDHRGLWGYGSVSPEYCMEDLESLLKAMYLEIEEQVYD
jgi:hypothetical protein